MRVLTVPTLSDGPAPDLSKNFPAGSEQQMDDPGDNQASPSPNENLANQPLSSDKTMESDHQQHTWNDQNPQDLVSEGVTENHADPQMPKHGDSADATSKSSTGLPEQGEERTGGGHNRPPSVQNSKK